MDSDKRGSTCMYVWFKPLTNTPPLCPPCSDCSAKGRNLLWPWYIQFSFYPEPNGWTHVGPARHPPIVHYGITGINIFVREQWKQEQCYLMILGVCLTGPRILGSISALYVLRSSTTLRILYMIHNLTDYFSIIRGSRRLSYTSKGWKGQKIRKWHNAHRFRCS